MNKEIKSIQITVVDEKDKLKVLDKIHNQLVGNQDYIDNNILLANFDNYVSLMFFKECKDIPEITI